MTSALVEARLMIRRGYCPIPITLGEKAPKKRKWTDLRIAEADAERHFKGETNMGLLLGNKAGGLIDVDLN